MNFDWEKIFLNELDWQLSLEILIRTLIMFTIVLVFLRLSGKKGIQQLSIFEVAIIIALGSAAGDPMLNEESAILPALIVFAGVLGLYRLLTFISTKSEKFESVLEGVPVYIIEEGMFSIENGDNTIAKDEFFAEMRVKSIEHLGQVKTAILETNGLISFYYYADHEVKPGLPILPKAYSKKSRIVERSGLMACSFCGNVEDLSADVNAQSCARCERDEWVKAIDTIRST
ncbi:MAG: YetF domain-containing protein [Flavitalea sp.]